VTEFGIVKDATKKNKKSPFEGFFDKGGGGGPDKNSPLSKDRKIGRLLMTFGVGIVVLLKRG